ncbi:MAG: hypothetical protein R3B90_18885 [Planctomycetaceae bacterium]
MIHLLRQLCQDDRGFVVSSELALVGTVAVAGATVGLTNLRDSVSNELTDVANSIGSLNQSYQYNGFSTRKGPCCTGAFTRGSAFIDVEDGVEIAAAEAHAESREEQVIQPSPPREDSHEEMLDRLRELERRRDELLQRQQQLSEEVQPRPEVEPELPTRTPGPMLDAPGHHGVIHQQVIEQPVHQPTIVQESVIGSPGVEYRSAPCTTAAGVLIPGSPCDVGHGGYRVESGSYYEGVPSHGSSGVNPAGVPSHRAQGKILGYTPAQIGVSGRVFPHINNYDSRFVGPPSLPAGQW